MAGMSLLQGGDNPIFKASQKIAEQEASRKDTAIQGIINQNIQIKAKQLGAELESATAMMQSANSATQDLGIKRFYELLGKSVPQDIAQHRKEVSEKSKAFGKDMGNPAILPNMKEPMLNEHIRDLGSFPTGLVEGYRAQIKQEQTGFEGGMLSQAAQIPALQKQGMLTPEQAQEGRFSALSQAGAAGTDILKAEMTQKDKPDTNITEAELALMAARGDKAAKAALANLQSKKQGENELSARNQIRNLVNGKLMAIYGGKGATYNQFEDRWIFPPGFDQKAFNADYDRVTSGFNKAYGIKDMSLDSIQGQGQRQGQGKGQVFDTLPDASKYPAGKIAKNLDTGESYISNGKTWVKVK